MRSFTTVITSSLATLALLPAGTAHAQAAKPPCIEVAGITTCPGTPVRPAPGEECAGKDDRPTAATVSRARAATLCLLNVERGAKGLKPLAANTPLRGAAQRFARRMAVGNFFSHVGPRGDTLRDRVKATSYLKGARRWSLGENIAFGAGTHATPEQIVRSWMGSPGHRRNVLDRGYQHIGLGIADGLPTASTSTGSTYVTVFGSR